MKKVFSLKTILLFVGSFAVINVAVYFFLKATQPKSAAPALSAQVEHPSPEESVTDSTAHVPSESAQPVQQAAEDMSGSQKPSVQPTEEEVPSPKNTDAVVAREQPTEPAAEVVVPEEINPEDQAMDLADTMEKGDPRQLQRLAKLLGAMKPQQAAPIMTRLSDETIVALFMSMKERSAAKVMALLPVEQAARVSNLMTQMAGHASR
jgi:cytoskeletal protein RodZ